MKKFISIASVALCTVMLVTGCGGSTEKISKVEAIKNAGKITMYTNPEFPPYEYAEGDKIVGADIEIAQAIADKLEVELEVISAEFGGIVASIGSGKGDMALSGITITEERKKEVDFSVPYVDSVQYIILPEGSDIKVLEDLEGKAVGGQQGTTGVMLIEAEMEEGVLMGKNVELKQYNSAPTAMADIQAGRISAVIIDELVAISIANANPGTTAIPLKYSSGEPLTEQFGVAIAKGNEDLLEVINEVVSELVESGKVEQYIEQYSEE